MPRRTSLLALLLLAGFAVTAGWLAWRCRLDARIHFLPGRSPAKWILYPGPPDVLAHVAAAPGHELSAVFRRTIVLESVPANALLQVCALESFAIQINGQPALAGPASNWKSIREFNASPALVRGTNQIEITVTNRAGPPLLWLVLKMGEQRVVSDATWEASYAGAVGLPAGDATTERPFRPGNPMLAQAPVAGSWRANAWAHAKVLLLAVILVSIARSFATTRRELFTPRDTVKFALGGMVLLWVALFIHNLNQVSPTSGFDSQQHLGYIQFVQDRHQLPKPEEGWEAHQPPLYYVFTALLLEALGLKAASPEGVTALRVLAVLSGLGQIFLVFASLRLVFPDEIRRPLAGTALAAFLPAHLYHAHYITNETFLALLMSGVFYLCLRVLRADRAGPLLWAGLGACLGAALLTKISALVVAPVVFAALAAKLVAKREWSLKTWLGTVGLSLAGCLLVCGWYYWRLAHEAGPLGNPSRWAYGSGWWQEDGYRTSAYYLRFGRSLLHPLYSGFHSFWDGLYSTLWGDALCGGLTSVDFAPPWNYSLLAVGYWLALLPTCAVVTGFFVAFWNLCRRPSAEWFLFLGATMAFGLASIYFSLIAPGTSQVRSSFGLMLLVPFCALFAWGLDRLASRQHRLGAVLTTIAVWCAANSFFAHWIPGSSAQPDLFRAQLALKRGQFEEAARAAEAGLRRDPSKGMLRSFLIDSWNQIGRTNEARRLVREAVAAFPNDPLAHLDAAFDLAQAGELAPAIQETRRALELAPDHPMAARELVVLLSRAQRPEEALPACREALRIQPHDSELRGWLDQLQSGKLPATGPSRAPSP